MTVGYVDTNVIIHALTNDEHTAECQRFLRSLERGEASAHLHPIVLHELSYSVRRYVQQISRHDVADYLPSIVVMPGVVCDRDVMTSAVQRWRDTSTVSFADAFLSVLATMEACPVYTKNVRDLLGQGVSVPDPPPG